MRMRNKKGISPLIATVLLIGFTVALAGIVITWGSNFVKNITSGTEERTESTLACAGDLNFDRLVPSSMERIIHDQEIVLWSGGRPVRSFLYVKDAGILFVCP